MSEEVKALNIIEDNDESYVIFIESDGNLFKMRQKDAAKYYYVEFLQFISKAIPVDSSIKVTG